jgi:hypothetical protein
MLLNYRSSEKAYNKKSKRTVNCRFFWRYEGKALNKKQFFIISTSFLLIVVAVINSYAQFQRNGSIDIIFSIFILIGLIGTMSYLFKLAIGRWLLVIFYALQSVFVYTDSFVFALHPGISVHFEFWSGFMSSGDAEFIRLKINFLAVALMLLTWGLLRVKPQNKTNQ